MKRKDLEKSISVTSVERQEIDLICSVVSKNIAGNW